MQIKSTSTGPSASRGGSHTTSIARLAWLLDESIRLPGGFRVGIDGFIGLIPGVGDLLGLAASSYILYLARQAGAGKVVLLRMAANALLEAILGSIPVLGDVFDFVFKANMRNLKLLQRYSIAPTHVRRVSLLWLLGIALLMLAVIAGGLTLVVLLLQWLVSLL